MQSVELSTTEHNVRVLHDKQGSLAQSRVVELGGPIVFLYRGTKVSFPAHTPTSYPLPLQSERGLFEFKK